MNYHLRNPQFFLLLRIPTTVDSWQKDKVKGKEKFLVPSPSSLFLNHTATLKTTIALKINA